jgi:hypothetical protein
MKLKTALEQAERVLRVYWPEESEEDPDSGGCALQQEAENGHWVNRGEFAFMELAMKRMKDSSVLLHERGKSRREKYRLICKDTQVVFAYFDVFQGVLYPGTRPRTV